MSKIIKYDKFLKTNEELTLSMDSFKGLLNKVKSILPKSKIESFINDNKEEVEKVSDMISDENGDVDYKKAFEFVKKQVKK